MSDTKTGEKIELPVSLRDYFAGQALMAYRSLGAPSFEASKIATLCYNDADAMLKEREKETSND